MKIFKDGKKQPIKFKNFNFIGYHKDYTNACYYYKKLPRDNYELMECMLEGIKPELGAGTTIKVIDTFMTNYLNNLKTSKKFKTHYDFIKSVVETSYGDFEKEQKEKMASKFNSEIPSEIKKSKAYKELIDKGFELLYCSNDEASDRLYGIVNIVLVKEEHIVSKDKRINIDSKYTLFKPLKFRVSPGFIKGTSKQKYLEENIDIIPVCHDLLD